MLERWRTWLGLSLCSILGCFGGNVGAGAEGSMLPPATGAAPADPNAGAASADPNAAAAPADPNAAAAGPFFGAPRCAAAGVRFCDDFEAGTPGAPPDPSRWTLQVHDASDWVRLDDARAARGSRSLHVHTLNRGYEQALAQVAKIFPMPDNSFYGRAFMFLMGPAPQPHTTFFVASGTLPGGNMPTLLRYGGQFGLFLANYIGKDEYQHAGVDMGGTWTDATPLPTDRWACLEWQYDGAHNAMRLWLDEVPIARMSVLGKSADCCPDSPWTAPPYRAFALGWEIYSNTDKVAGYDVWYDEVALDPNRIGCSR